MKTLFIMLLLVICTAAQAQGTTDPWEIYLEVHGVSKHFDTRTKYNERNLGYGYTVTKSNMGLTVGKYLNSIYRTSTYVAFTQSIQVLEGVEVGYELGLINGYGHGLSPLVIPKISVQLYKRTGLNIRIIPAIEDITPAVASVSFTIKLR